MAPPPCEGLFCQADGSSHLVVVFQEKTLAVALNALKGLNYLHIAIGHNPAKKGLFTVGNRKAFISEEVRALPLGGRKVGNLLVTQGK